MTERLSSSVFTKSAVPEPLIGALLRMAWEGVRRHMLEHLRERGFADLEAAHLSVLQYPGPGGVRPSELARRLQVSKQALNYLLGELERLGYLERRPDPDDLRSKRIELTARGRAASAAMRESVADVERNWRHRLGDAGFAQLRELLLELGREP